MPAPASTMIVTNNSNGNIWVFGQNILPANSYTFTAGQFPQVCADMNLRLGMLSGSLQVNLNGNVFGSNGVPVGNTLTDLFDQVVAGALTVP